MNLRAAIFDMDGLLVDTEPLWTRAEMETFATVGIHLQEKDCAETVGLGLEQVVDFRYLRTPWTGPSKREIAAAIHRRVLELVSTDTRPMPGALQALGLARSLGWKIGLATASDPQLIHAALSCAGMLDFFDHLQSAEGLPAKPHPEVYFQAARMLGVRPADCVGLEDSLPGLRAVKSAGMKAVAVPEPRLRNQPGFREADLLLGSLEQLRSEHLLNL